MNPISRQARSPCWRRGLLRLHRSEGRQYARIHHFHSSSRLYDSEKLKVLFMGRDEFSCLVLRELYAASDVWDELVVATNQDQRVGRRGSQLSVSPLKVLAQDLKGVRLEYIPHTKPEFRKWELPAPFASFKYRNPLSADIANSASDHGQFPPKQHVLVTASFGRILTRRHLSHFLPHRRLNVHPSLLPQYRGPAPIQHTLLNGDTETGVCVIEMLDAVKKRSSPSTTEGNAPSARLAASNSDASGAVGNMRASQPSGIDAGGIWASKWMLQPSTADFAFMRDILASEGGKLLVQVLRKMKDGIDDTPEPQLKPGVEVALRPAPMIGLEDALVDPSTMSAENISRKWRAIGHQKPIYTFRTGSNAQGQPQKPIQLHDLSVLRPQRSAVTDDIERLLPRAPGSVICTSAGTDIQEIVCHQDRTNDNRSQKKQEKHLFIRCSDGDILVVPNVKPDGKPMLPAAAFWNGIKTKESDGSIRFGPGSHQPS